MACALRCIQLAQAAVRHCRALALGRHVHALARAAGARHWGRWGSSAGLGPRLLLAVVSASLHVMHTGGGHADLVVCSWFCGWQGPSGTPASASPTGCSGSCIASCWPSRSTPCPGGEEPVLWGCNVAESCAQASCRCSWCCSDGQVVWIAAGASALLPPHCSRRVVLKGDIPIGVDKRSMDTWVAPHYFRMDKSTGGRCCREQTSAAQPSAAQAQRAEYSGAGWLTACARPAAARRRDRDPHQTIISPRCRSAS
jgi:hypothetical protein